MHQITPFPQYADRNMREEKDLSFASRVLNNHEIKYSSTDKESLAVVLGVQIDMFFMVGGLKSLQTTRH